MKKYVKIFQIELSYRMHVLNLIIHSRQKEQAKRDLVIRSKPEPLCRRGNLSVRNRKIISKLLLRLNKKLINFIGNNIRKYFAITPEIETPRYDLYQNSHEIFNKSITLDALLASSTKSAGSNNSTFFNDQS